MFKTNTRRILMTLALLAAVFGFEHFKHRFDRPWAYAYEPGKPVLIGKWEGTYKDPDGISKKIEMEIAEPEMEKNEDYNFRREYEQSREFAGSAKITSILGVENDRVAGVLGSDDGHNIFRINFIPVEETKTIRESFNTDMSEPGGIWEGDVIKIRLGFTYRTKIGSALWDSADPRYKAKVPVTLRRVK